MSRAQTNEVNGYTLEALRGVRFMSKTELAEAASVSLAYVSELESGAKKAASISVIRRLAEALEVDPFALVVATRAKTGGVDRKDAA